MSEIHQVGPHWRSDFLFLTNLLGRRLRGRAELADIPVVVAVLLITGLLALCLLVVHVRGTDCLVVLRVLLQEVNQLMVRQTRIGVQLLHHYHVALLWVENQVW